MVSTFKQTWYITCVRRELYNGYWIITALSGPAGTWTYSEVIALINSGQHQFFTTDGVTEARIEVHPGTSGGYYLQTVSDGILTNNLEELGSCVY